MELIIIIIIMKNYTLKKSCIIKYKKKIYKRNVKMAIETQIMYFLENL